MDWYEENIETPIRPIVKILRDNGFNTTCSCGHDMEVQLNLLEDGEVKRLKDVLFNAGYRSYCFQYTLNVTDGITWAENVTLKF